MHSDGDDSAQSLVLSRTESADDGGVAAIPDTEYAVPVTRVLRATGQEKHVGFLASLPGITTDDGGRVVVNDTFRTGNPLVWAGGDCVNGGKEVVNAVAHGKAAATDIDKTLRDGAAGK